MTDTDHIIEWLRETFEEQRVSKAVIGISGGIDSALSLTLLTRALGTEAVTPVLLPYGDQDMTDGHFICDWNGFTPSAIYTIDIKPIVDTIARQLNVTAHDTVRLGNIKARIRMITLFDLAKAQRALVCGTENKTEHYLGYFTRFGDAASDVEPICQLYKTEVQAMASELGLPSQLITKPPSAGLWADQTDEAELGFRYVEADTVLRQLIDQHVTPEQIKVDGVAPETIQKIIQRVDSQAFKRAVPYYYGQ